MDGNAEFLRKTPRQSRSRAVVGALVTALEQLVEKSEDLAGISVGKVAERAGVGIGSLYDYFKTREGLFGEFVARLTDENFERMKTALDATRGKPLRQAVDAMVNTTLDTYLVRPKRTKAAILTIFRLGWISPIISERDRFAGALAERILLSAPALEPARVTRACRLLCDAVMGVVATQVWRGDEDGGLEAGRAALRSLTDALLTSELGLVLDGPDAV
jgi:AcrR family transcriptional regulator